MRQHASNLARWKRVLATAQQRLRPARASYAAALLLLGATLVGAGAAGANPQAGVRIVGSIADDVARFFGLFGGRSAVTVAPLVTSQVPAGWIRTAAGLYVPQSVPAVASLAQPQLVQRVSVVDGTLDLGTIGTVFGVSVVANEIPFFQLAGDTLRLAAYCMGNPCLELAEKRLTDWYLAPFNEQAERSEASGTAALIDCSGIGASCSIILRGVE